MHMISVGLHYKSAPVEIREKMAFQEQDIANAMLALNNQKSVLENVILSTCNRTEIYAVVDQLHTGRHYVKQFLADWFNLDKEAFTSHLQILVEDEAVEHLLRVTSSLDSMILGETQILGQVKDAFHSAQNNKTTGTLFNELFKQAITFAKRAHKKTAIGEQAVSVSYTAVELAKNIFGDLKGKRIAILGTGEMGELALKNLYSSGATQLTVVNRTLEKAQQLADKFHAKAEQFSQLFDVLQQVDIVISSTGADSFILSKENLEQVQKKRKGKPLFLVDIAVPRDIDSEIGELDNVFLYDIDDLQHIVDENLATRKQAAESIEALLEQEIAAFNEWVQTLGVVPVIKALRSKALSIQTETMKSIERKMPDLTDREKKVLNKHTKSIINQLLKDPVTQAKELAATEDAPESLSLFADIFGIREAIHAEVQEQDRKQTTTDKANPNPGALNAFRKRTYPVK